MPSHLIRLVQSQQWREVVDVCRRSPAEARKKGSDGEVALHGACRVGAPLHVLRALRSAYPDAVRRGDGFGSLPLHRACRARSPIDVLQFLCEGGTDNGGGDNSINKDLGGIRARDMDGWIPLHIAAHYGASLEAVRYLHGLYAEGITVNTNLGHTPLHMACADGSHAPADVIRYLRAEYPAGCDARDARGKTPFDLAWESSRANKDATIDALVGPLVLSAGRNSSSESSAVAPAPSGAVYPQRELDVSLFRLISAGHWSEVERRCRWPRPDEANARNTLGDPPLHHACRRPGAPLSAIRSLAVAFPESVRTASADEGGGGADLPLHCACAAGADLAVVRYLRDAYPDATRTANRRGSLPLHLSCYRVAPLDVVLVLCESYPRAVRIPDRAGYLPLHYSCKGGAGLDVIQYLYRACPAAAAKENKIGKTPVTYVENSSRSDRDEVLAALGGKCGKSALSDDDRVAKEDIARGRRDMGKALDLEASPPVPLPLAYLEDCTNQFHDDRKIGEGAFGVVYRGVDDELRRVFAVKRIRCQYRRDSSPVDPQEARKAFRKEIAVLSHFRHPNIARLYAYSFDNGIDSEQCLVYDFASKGDLAAFLRDEERRKRLDWRTRIRIALDVASALKYLHDGCSGYVCYHRDVKPANIVLKRDFHACLIDCGLSKMLPADDSQMGLSIMSSSRGGVLGSPGYWCPEYALTGSDFSSASEVFSLGIVLIELFSGRLQNSVVNGKRLNFFVKFRNKKARDRVSDSVDDLAGEWDLDAQDTFAKLSLKCISPQPERRPKIGSVVSRLSSLAAKYCGTELPKEIDASKGTCTKCSKAFVCGSFCQKPQSPHFLCTKCVEQHVDTHLGEDDIFCPVSVCQSLISDEHILRSTSVTLLSRHLDAKYLKKYSSLVTKATASISHRITVLFSAPLAYKVDGGVFQPIEPLCFEREKELLVRSFREASTDIHVTFDTATAERLHAAIINSSSMLHYSGHGYPSYLVLEDGKGGVHWFGVDELEALMSKGNKKTAAPFDFVFVSACESEMTGETFVSAGVPHVLCCQHGSNILDSAACEFTRAFYHALAVGHTIKDSFDAGKKAVAVSPSVCSIAEIDKFVLLPKDGEHDVVVFDAHSVDEWQQDKSTIMRRKGMLPAPPEYFIGRDVDVYHVLNAVLSRRFVSIVGPPGIGRRSVAASLCHYISERLTTIIGIESVLFIRPPIYMGRTNRSLLAHIYTQTVSAFPTSPGQPFDANSSPAVMGQLVSECIGETKLLLVLDAIEHRCCCCDDFACFLRVVFQEAKYVKVLLISGVPLERSSSLGVTECVHSLGPLNEEDSMQLFGLCSPHIQSEGDHQCLLERFSRKSGQYDVNCTEVQRGTTGTEAGSPIKGEGCEISAVIRSGNPSAIFKAAQSTLLEDITK